MIAKQIKFTADQIEQIQLYADMHCEGNFNQAVRKLCVMSLPF